jgi:hypothetical protein
MHEASAFAEPEQLYASSCARVTLSQDLTLHIAAQEGAVSVSEEDVTAVLAATENLMAQNLEFQTLWDLRACPVPSVTVVARCVRWALKHKPLLDRLNRRLAVVVPAGRALAALVATVLTTFGPTCDVHVSSNQVDAARFMRRQTSPSHTDKDRACAPHEHRSPVVRARASANRPSAQAPERGAEKAQAGRVVLRRERDYV